MTAVVLYAGSEIDVNDFEDQDINPEILERKLAALKGQEKTIRDDLEQMLRDLNGNCVDLQMRIVELNNQLAELLLSQSDEQQSEQPQESEPEEDIPEEFTKNDKRPSKEAVMLFRRIAKLTHPDSIGNDSKVEIFHLAAKRYKERDVEGLRRILTSVLRNSKITKLVEAVVEDLLTEIATTEATIQDLRASEEYMLLQQYTAEPAKAYASYRSFKLFQIKNLLQEIGKRTNTDLLTATIIVGEKQYKVLGLENVQDKQTDGKACRLTMSENDAHGFVREHMLVEGALDITVQDLSGKQSLKSTLREFKFSTDKHTVVVYLMKLGE